MFWLDLCPKPDRNVLRRPHVMFVINVILRCTCCLQKSKLPTLFPGDRAANTVVHGRILKIVLLQIAINRSNAQIFLDELRCDGT